MKKIYKPIISLFMLLIIAGCGEFLDINDTPNNPLQVSPAVMLPPALAASAFANGNELNRFGSVLMDYQTGAANNPAAYDIYNTSGADFGNQWRFEIYDGALITYKKMIEAAEPLGAKTYAGIGKIMTAYTFGIATDTWGDIPYSQALQGDAGLVLRRVDSQEDIYKGNPSLGIKSLFDLINEGLADLNAPPSNLRPGTDDTVYGGDTIKWKRAGNSILIKFALQMSGKEPELAKQIINEVVARNKFINSNTDNLGVKFGSVTGSQSPAFQYTYTSSFQNDMIVSTRYVNMLNSFNDPRLPILITKPTGAYVTLDNGIRNVTPPVAANWSRWSTALLGVGGVGPIKLMTYAQTMFMLSEAVLTLGVTPPAGETAQSLYRKGITASMLDYGVPQATIDTYLASYGTLTGSTSDQLKTIITQKYIALTGNGLEAWNDWRRTGFPAFAPAEHQNAVGINGTRPVRAQYIDQEIQRNPNFTLVTHDQKVWWDVN